jgi:hypothetical protein
MSRDVKSYTHWLRPGNPHSPAFRLAYTRALLVSQDGRHLFVTPLPQREQSELETRSALADWRLVVREQTQKSKMA